MGYGMTGSISVLVETIINYCCVKEIQLLRDFIQNIAEFMLYFSGRCDSFTLQQICKPLECVKEHLYHYITLCCSLPKFDPLVSKTPLAGQKHVA